MAQGKWYTVWVGRQTGIYNSWEECKEQVDNFPDARYKAFNDQEAATIAFRGSPSDHIGILKSIIEHKATTRRMNYADIPGIDLDAIAVDASCMGNPGVMEYQGVWIRTGEVVFRKGPYRDGTNNVGEFLALIHALALTKKQGLNTTIYSDSRTAISWVRNRLCKTTLKPTPRNTNLIAILNRAISWMNANTFENRIIKWDTESGRNPSRLRPQISKFIAG